MSDKTRRVLIDSAIAVGGSLGTAASLTLAAALVLAPLAVAAAAQAAPVESASPVQPGPTTRATTEQTPSSVESGGLEEIVVTARRREERLQSVPLSVTAFTQAQIEREQINDIHDLALHVPSVAVNQPASDSNARFSSALRIRGLAGAEVYFADVPIGSADSNPATGVSHAESDGFLYDLEDLEVIKGPQGTLFGKNSIGGLISYQPKRPTDDFEGYIRTTFGNYGDKENEFAVNVPIVDDKLSLRVAGQMQQRDGYTYDEMSGKYLDNKNYYAWRVGILFRPTDDLQDYFLYDGYWQDMNGSTTIPSFLNPGHTFTNLSLPGLGSVPLTLGNGVSFAALENPATAAATIGQLLAIKKAGGQPSLALYSGLQLALAAQQALGVRAEIGSNAPSIGKDYFYGFTNITTWDVLDNLTIKNIVAARIFKDLTAFNDLPLGGGFPVLAGVTDKNAPWSDNSGQYTEEIQFQGKAIQDKLIWIAGGYLEYDHPIGDADVGAEQLGNTPLGSTPFYHYHIISRSQAAFAHGDYNLDDYVQGLKFTAGYRYTWDFASTATRGISGSDTITRNAAGIATNCVGTFLTDNNCYQQAPDAHFSSYGWNLGLEEQLDPSTLIYVRAGNAFRPGGATLNVTQQYALYQPEHVTDVELGVKSDWHFMGMSARTNADIFHTDYKSIQVSQTITLTTPQGKIQAATATQNAASAELEGAEFEGTFLPFKGVEIEPHFSYLYAKYDQYPINFNPAGTSTPFQYLPKWQYGITGTYHLPLDESYGDVAVSANYSWYGHQYASAAAGEIHPIEPSYDLLNVRADWTNIMGRPYDLSFWMTNALNATYVQGEEPLYSQLGFTSLTYGAPRMWGFTLKMRFGPGLDTGLGL